MLYADEKWVIKVLSLVNTEYEGILNFLISHGLERRALGFSDEKLLFDDRSRKNHSVFFKVLVVSYLRGEQNTALWAISLLFNWLNYPKHNLGLL